MELYPDFKELLALFNSRHVEYIVIGGYAMAFHGVPRYTGDIDLLVRPTKSNAQRIVAALEEFGFGRIALQEEDFLLPRQVVQLGVPPVRIDLVNGRARTTGVNCLGGIGFPACSRTAWKGCATTTNPFTYSCTAPNLN